MADGLEYVCFRVDAREDFAAKFAAKDLGVGLLLAMYCGEKLNGGRIKLAKKWTKNEWLLRVHVAEKLSRSCAGLWRWEGDDLVVECYDAEIEKRVLSRREKRQGAARARWGTDASADANADANAMQMQSKCNASADANAMHSREVKVKVKDNNMVGKVKGSSTAAGACDGEPATTTTTTREDDEVFGRWLTRLCGAHPTLRGCGILAPDVAEAAEAAFARCPQLEEEAELIGAYMADRLQEDRYRHKFWRPLGQARFFEKLEDVLAHARAWDRETGWGAKRKKKAAKAADGRCTMDDVRCGSKAASPRGEEDEPASEEEMEKFRAELRGLRCGSEAPSAHGKGGEG